MPKKVTKKMHLTLHLMLHSRVHLPVQSRMPLRVHLKICLMVYFEIYIKMHKKRILGWIQGCTLGNYWVTLVDVHGGALVSAQECKKRFSKKLNLRENSMLHLNARLIFHFTEYLKMYKNVKEEIYAAGNYPLDNAFKECTWGYNWGCT